MSAFPNWLPRPLDPLRSLKLKIGILVVASIAAATLVFYFGVGWFPRTTVATAAVLSLVVTQVLAHGMTSPLREMTAAAKAMARGDYSRRVRASSRDEVGELAHAFNQMAADLGAADRQRRELIANVSHELRTPISALQAVLENIVDGVTPADAGTLGAALTQTERLGRLVTELLDLSRIDAGVHLLDADELPLADLFAEVAAEAQVSAAAVGRSVEFAFSVDPPETIGYGDRERLYQVILNLLDNAARHSPPGGLVTLTGTGSGADLVIEVADSGPGIPRAERQRVFERFTRGERASDGGTGLGLAIAHWVVELHGGSISVVDPEDAAEPTGCRIRVVLPGGPAGGATGTAAPGSVPPGAAPPGPEAPGAVTHDSAVVIR
ncbi:MAG TPA: ATP-binding protein [Micromonosporaceae bacterium]|nr:ATP-binding protein [Micromonosporaceae bacterium]